MHVFQYALIAIIVSCTAIAQNSGTTDPGANAASEQQIAQNKFFLKLKQYRAIPMGAIETGIPEIDAVLKQYTVRGIKALHECRSLLKGTEPNSSGIDRLVIVFIEPVNDVSEILRRFQGMASLEYAAPYRYFKFASTPNDSLYADQYELKQARLDEAWDITTGDSSIVIGIVDSGVDMDHPDLVPNLYTNPGEWGTQGELSNNGIDDDNNGYIDDWRGWDFIGTGTSDNPKPDNNPLDAAIGHGTKVAGCASAATNNGIGIASPGYRTKLLPVKVCDDVTSNLAAGYEGILYAADMGCDIINCSWEVLSSTDIVFSDVVTYAFEKGALVVIAAGNSSENIGYPQAGHLRRAIFVGATDTLAQMTAFSRYGLAVDVFAPGSNVMATTDGGGYKAVSGTSFSSPLTAGVAALLMSVHPDWTNDQIAKQIRVTSRPFATTHDMNAYGILDAYSALTVNETMNDIPGVCLKNLYVDTPQGNVFSAPGQTATVTLVFQNLLAPTTSQLTAELSEYFPFVCSQTVFHLGALGTGDSILVQFEATLPAKYEYSTNSTLLKFTFTDGEYIDYDTGTMEVVLTESWTEVYNSGFMYTFNGIHTVDANTVWTIGKMLSGMVTVLRTIDGGITWNQHYGPEYPLSINATAITATDSSTAWITTSSDDVRKAAIYKTTNGGQTWKRTDVSSITDSVRAIHMYDSQNGIFIGDGMGAQWGIGKTTDGGDTWHTIANPPGCSSSSGITGSADFYKDCGWFGTTRGTLLSTTDRGDTWISIPLLGTNITEISFRNETDGLVRFACFNGNGADTIAVTSDGGTSWTYIESVPGASGGFLLYEPDGKKAWAGVGRHIYVSESDATAFKIDPAPWSTFLGFLSSDIFSNGDSTYCWAGSYGIHKRVKPYEPKTVGIRNLTIANDFTVNVYPNPVTAGTPATLTIDGATNCTIAVYDMNGRKRGETFHFVSAGTAHIPTAGLAAGTYTIALRNSAQQRNIRFTVIR